MDYSEFPAEPNGSGDVNMIPTGTGTQISSRTGLSCLTPDRTAPTCSDSLNLIRSPAYLLDMQTNIDNGPSGFFHQTTAVGLWLRQEQLRLQHERDKELAMSDLDRFHQDAIVRCKGQKVPTPKSQTSPAAPKSRTQQQIEAARAKFESRLAYWKRDPETGAWTQLSK